MPVMHMNIRSGQNDRKGEVGFDSITCDSIGIGTRAGGVPADFEFRSSGIGSLAF